MSDMPIDPETFKMVVTGFEDTHHLFINVLGGFYEAQMLSEGILPQMGVLFGEKIRLLPRRWPEEQQMVLRKKYIAELSSMIWYSCNFKLKHIERLKENIWAYIHYSPSDQKLKNYFNLARSKYLPDIITESFLKKCTDESFDLEALGQEIGY